MKSTAWHDHWKAKHRGDYGWPYFQEELFEAGLLEIPLGRGFFTSPRCRNREGIFYYHSISELAGIFHLLLEYPDAEFQKIENYTPDPTYILSRDGEGNYFPDFVLFLDGKPFAIAEIKSDLDKHYQAKKKALAEFALRERLLPIWLDDKDPRINPRSNPYKLAFQAAVEARRDTVLVTRGRVTARCQKSIGRYIAIDGNALFSGECSVCGEDIFYRHTESRDHYCGRSGRRCERNEELAKVGKRICKTCRTVWPIEMYPNERGYTCTSCLIDAEKIGRSCDRCKKPMGAGGRRRLCDSCASMTIPCAACGKIIEEPGLDQVRKHDDGKPVYCGARCNLANIRANGIEVECSVCSKPFRGRAGWSQYCDDCRLIACVMCDKTFLADAHQMLKLKKKALTKDSDRRHAFESAKAKSRLRCPPCRKSSSKA